MGQLQKVAALVKLVVVVAVAVEGAVGVAVVGGDRLLDPAGLGHVVGAVLYGVHIGGQVGVLAAAAGDDNDRRVGEGGGVGHHPALIVLAGGLGQGPVLGVHAYFRAALPVLEVHVRKLVVGGVARVLKGLDNTYDTGAVVAAGGGAGAAVDRVSGGPAEDVQALHITREREQSIVLDQDHALLGGLLHDGAAVARHVVGDLSLGGVEDARDDGVHGAIADEIYNKHQRQ